MRDDLPFREIKSPNYARTVKSAQWEFWNPPGLLSAALWPHGMFQSERTGSWSLDRKGYPFFRVELMTEGQVCYETNTGRTVSRQGEVHISPAGMDVRVFSVDARPCRRLGLELTGSLLYGLCGQLNLNRFLNGPAASGAAFEALLRRIYTLLREKKTGTESELFSLCGRVTADLAQTFRPAGLPGCPPRLAAVLDAIHTSPGFDWTRAELAARAGCGEATLNRLFREFLHTAPLAYLRKIRLEYARQFLLTGEYAVKELAEKFGFPNQFYFSRCFRREFGVPPSQFR